jgi:hypothetical protein
MDVPFLSPKFSASNSHPTTRSRARADETRFLIFSMRSSHLSIGNFLDIGGSAIAIPSFRCEEANQ